MTVLEAVLAFFVPPVAVGLKKGWFTRPFWTDVVLTILGHVPGVVYALVVITAES